jgi:hypothetical protein
MIAAIFACVLVLIGLPGLGAKTGGALAAVPAMVTALLARRGWRVSFRGVVVVVLLTALVVGGLFAMDAMRSSSSQSHMGRFVGLVAGGDTSGLMSIVQRKVAINFMLVETSPWSRLLGLSLLGSTLMSWFGKRRFRESFLDIEQASAAIACSVGIVCAFAFNDSGVLAAATCAVFLWSMLAVRIVVAFGEKP